VAKCRKKLKEQFPTTGLELRSLHQRQDSRVCMLDLQCHYSRGINNIKNTGNAKFGMLQQSKMTAYETEQQCLGNQHRWGQVAKGLCVTGVTTSSQCQSHGNGLLDRRSRQCIGQSQPASTDVSFLPWTEIFWREWSQLMPVT